MYRLLIQCKWINHTAIVLPGLFQSCLSIPRLLNHFQHFKLSQWIPNTISWPLSLFSKKPLLHHLYKLSQLASNLDSLRVEVLSSCPVIVALLETWINPAISDSEIFIPGYSTIRRDRSRHGGGILFYVNESIAINSIPLSIHETSEFMSVEVRLK